MVEQGGLLIRFAGPRTAEQPIGEIDPLMPVKLLRGDRQLGGALSWAEPAGVAQFVAGSPFSGLTVTDEVKVKPPGTGGALGRPREPHLGGAGGWHAAGDADDSRGGPRGAVPRHRQCRLVEPAAVGPVRRHAAPAGGAVGRRRAHRGQHRAGPGRDAGRIRAAVPPAASGDRPRGGCDRAHRKPRRAIRPACTDPRTAGGRSTSAPTCRRRRPHRRCRARGSRNMPGMRQNARSDLPCSLPPHFCWYSTC